MNAISFTQQIRAMSDRLAILYQNYSSASPAMLNSLLKDLGIATERLEMAAEMLCQQSQKLAVADQDSVINRQQYRSLLDFIPDACLLTDLAGVIQEANQATATLLNCAPASLIGQSLSAFMATDRLWFQSKLQQLQQKPGKQEWQMQLQRCAGKAVETTALVEFNPQELQPSLRWLFRYPRNCAEQEQSDGAYLGYPLQFYQKGETIPLNPQDIWQVRSGLVKLTTYVNSGQEILIGLAGASAPFGSSLTALPLYEATALTDTRLWCIPLTEFAASAELTQRLLPQISQRLRQTELLLAIYGQLRVTDRLHSLLQLLKDEIGQPVANGIRLSARLTHEDLATACCTTRVTVTRLLSQLQQQQKLGVDSQHHLILKRDIC